MFVDASLITRDGTELVSRVWRPRGSGPWPALLMRQPYGRAIASTVTLTHPDWWCSHGFLVVVQDVRGQGDSGGTFRGFCQEAMDMADTLTWLRAMDDVNGHVGVYGFSYQGLTQLLGPAEITPPDCMAPAMCGLDEREHWSCEGQAHWWHLGLGWGLQLAALQAQRRNDHAAWNDIRRSLDSGSYLKDGRKLLERHDPNGMALRWLNRRADKHAGWTRYRVPASWLQQPMLLLGGWWDPHLRGVLDLAQRSWATGGCPELHIGPATHLQWWPQSAALLLSFFQRHLIPSTATIGSAGDDQDADVIRLWDQVESSWCGLKDRHASVDSSVERSKELGGPWHLSSRGLACLDPEDGRILKSAKSCGGRVVIVHDPWRPVPAVGGHLSPSAGPCDRSGTDMRSDVAVFTGDPLTSALRLSGRPWLRLCANADQPGFDLCVALSRLPAGTDIVQQLSTGVLRTLGQDALMPSDREMELQALHATLQPGDRLRLSVAAAAWPAIAINPGHQGEPCGPPSSSCRVISIELHLDTAQLRMLPLLMHQSEGTPADLRRLF